MLNILVTGGTGFVSGRIAAYFTALGHHVSVLNRGNSPQLPGVSLIRGDRRLCGDLLRGLRFDAVIDAVAYDAPDVETLLPALEGSPVYVLISSSAVYPETLPQPFTEAMPTGENRIWGAYGLGKVRAENAALCLRPDSYILRPPYLYGPGQNLYREPFVFDCARQGRPFCLPGQGEMPLHFCHMDDLCRLIDILITRQPESRILNVGDAAPVTVRRWVEMCYLAAGAEPPRFISVGAEHAQRAYFPFHPYGYVLDVTKQLALLDALTPLQEGLRQSFAWYMDNENAVPKRDYLTYIDARLASPGASSVV